MRAHSEPAQSDARDGLSLWPYCVQGMKEWWNLSLASLSGIRKSNTPVRRLLWLLFVLPAGFLLLLSHWVCFWIDDLLFPGARLVELHRPVFVLGPPRCGTTHLHRMLALNTPEFVTSPAWEVFLAPTVVQKKILRFLLRIDRTIGAPGRSLVRWLERKLSGGFDQTHPGSLADPEEDYFYLLPAMACTGIALAFPDWTGFRPLVPGLPEASREDRRRALAFYRFCLRKQLYLAGPGARLLSKNASYSSWMDVLPELFPDAQWISCMRDPAKAVPSMLSTADTAMSDFFVSGREEESREWLRRSMEAHYQIISRLSGTLPETSFQVVSQTDLNVRLEQVLDSLAQTFSWHPEEHVRNLWASKAETSRAYTSPHTYSACPDQLGRTSVQEAFPLTPATAPRP